MEGLWKNQRMALLRVVLCCILVQVSFCYVQNHHHLPRNTGRNSADSVTLLLLDASPAAVESPPETTTIDNDGIHSEARQQMLMDDNNDDDPSIFGSVARKAAVCLLESDKRRDAKAAQKQNFVASSTTNWINDATALELQKAVDLLQLKLAEERTGLDRDEASAWIRWMKSSPTPTIVDLSPALRVIANATLADEDFLSVEQSRTQFLSRMGARLVLLPSGSSLSKAFREPPASLIYGKLLYGGVTRFRMLASSNSQRPPRRTGERTSILASAKENLPAWIQYGGADRLYEAVDIGSAAVLEITLLPRGQSLLLAEKEDKNTGSSTELVVKNCAWKPQDIFGAHSEEPTKKAVLQSGYSSISQAGNDRNKAFEADFKEDVGGLQPQIDAIVRRVLDGRVIRPATDDGLVEINKDETSRALQTATLEARELALLGLTPVRGLLLYGPPGTGKTLLARRIATALKARSPKIVSAPELLDRWVGGSERLVRELFSEAEAELAACNGDSTRSALHVVVIDEIDAVFRRRSSGEDSGEQTRASVVNQILSKLDGVNAIDNILVVGMTNRRELLDSALLRPGRLEVQIEVPMPDKNGRREILNIHFGTLREKGRLSMPLCCAIDGVGLGGDSRSSNKVLLETDDEDDDGDGRKRKRDAFKRGLSRLFEKVRPCYDLAAETEGFSGADIAGLVRSAGSLALSRARREGSSVNEILITLEDAKHAIEEVKK